MEIYVPGYLEAYILIICAQLILVIESGDTTHCPGVAKRSGYHLDVFKNSCYLFVDTERHWDEAQKHCWGMGGELLNIKNMETMDYIKTKLYSRDLGWSNNGVWNGASDLRKRGWEWTTGEKLTFTYWADGEPSKLFGFLSVENCACMRRSDGWRWHDYHCHAPGIEYKYICQFELLHHTGKTDQHTGKSGDVEIVEGSGRVPFNAADDTAALIGLACGAVLLLLLLSVALYVLYRKHEQQKAQYGEAAVRLQTTGYATIITHQETANHDSDSEVPSVGETRPVSNVYLDPVEIGNRVYEEVPKDSGQGANRYGEVGEATHLMYDGAAASADDNDGGYLSATTSEASGATSGYCSGTTGKKVGEADYIEMNGANGVGPVKATNQYVTQPNVTSDTPKKCVKPVTEEDIHIYTNQLESMEDEVGYLRPLPPVPCGLQSSPVKKV